MNFPNIRYYGLHKANLLSEDEQNFSDDFVISNRIGSDSQVGTIWLAHINLSSFVIKVQSNLGKAHAEFEIQNYLSHKWPRNFLITYKCKDYSEHGNFIFMETAIGDLSQVLKYSTVDEKMLSKYILDVIQSVEIMSTEKIFHGDLHIRQIMIVLRNNVTFTKAVVGDFGEHLRIDSPTMHLSDLKTFFKSLLEIIHSFEISACLEFISQRISYIELNDLSYNLLSLQQDISDIKNYFF